MTAAVIVSTARTPLTKSWKGAFNMTHGATLGGHVVEHAIQRAGIEAAEVDDVIMGCVMQVAEQGVNIGRNAVQAIGERGRLTLRTRAVVNATIGARRHRVVASIQFEDDGPGVPTDLADKIFYPLVTSRADGTGLGLAVAQDLVTRHGGLIEFESRPGHTVFTLLLHFDGVSNG